MLFVDRDFIVPADLTSRVATIAGIASAANVQLSDVIANEIRTVANILNGRLQTYDSGIVIGGELSPKMQRAVLDGSPFGGGKAYLHQVVVDSDEFGSTVEGPSAIKDWMVARMIRNAARAAVNRVLDDDRYADTFAFWNAEARNALNILEGQGLKIVSTPIYAPAATRVGETGTWSASNLALSAGAGALGNALTVYVAITFTGAAYASSAAKNNSESASCLPVSITTTALNDRIIVNKSSVLVPSSANMPPGLASVPAIAPTGWNVYAGLSADELTLQNSSPIAIGTNTFNLDALAAGAPLGKGQYADRYCLIPSRFLPS